LSGGRNCANRKKSWKAVPRVGEQEGKAPITTLRREYRELQESKLDTLAAKVAGDWGKDVALRRGGKNDAQREKKQKTTITKKKS